MTNKDRQASLDKEKWLESEKMGVDMSGEMPYCGDCEHQLLGCLATHEKRVENCLCAKAYNRMARRRKRLEVRGVV
ncbi:MAG: hypothetical protein IJE92_05525 [Clostridia bacterium]|nr:hypothetical protein [Clostridia bacterium]